MQLRIVRPEDWDSEQFKGDSGQKVLEPLMP